MLLTRRLNIALNAQDTANVHNYYERLVAESLLNQEPRASNCVLYQLHDADYIPR